MKLDTFNDIEKHLKIARQPKEYLEYGLPKWYESKRHTSFKMFSIGDFCICLRQNIYLDYLMDKIIKIFEKDVFGGEQYDGEMLAAFKSVDHKYWILHKTEMNVIENILKANMGNMDEDMKKDAQHLLTIFEKTK